MFIGHFGVAFAAKSVAPRLSLGTAFLAAQFADLLWPTLLLLGVESVRIAPGATAVTPLIFEHYPVSHSLATGLLWGGFLGAVHYFARGSAKSAVTVGVLVLSHWLLDALVHIPDLPLLSGSGTLVGLGLWQSKAATLALEVPIFAIGVWLYVRATPTMSRTGRVGLAALVVFMAIIQVANFAGPPPPSVAAIAWVGQAQWLLVAWAYWVDSRCAPVDPPKGKVALTA